MCCVSWMRAVKWNHAKLHHVSTALKACWIWDSSKFGSMTSTISSRCLQHSHIPISTLFNLPYSSSLSLSDTQFLCNIYISAIFSPNRGVTYISLITGEMMSFVYEMQEVLYQFMWFSFTKGLKVNDVNHLRYFSYSSS